MHIYIYSTRIVKGISVFLTSSSNSFIPNVLIPSKDVISALSELNSKKVYGPNGHSVFLKSGDSEIAPCLGKLFCHCLFTSTFPSCWKRALIQPVLKKGDSSQLSNNRPISLTSILLKFFNLSKIGRFGNFSI